ncbi:hypothetical protein LC607_17070 [Nostoc sp. CHAB 5824]|nr:hypothetical protein [Nostoc sp. CHAB 5824]
MNAKAGTSHSLGRNLFLSALAGIKPSQSDGAIDTWEAHVLPHGSIEELAPQLWHITGILPGVAPPREMVLYRLPDSTLLIHSAIALNETEMQKLEALGNPHILIVPNRIHRLDAAVYKQRYPQLTIVCPAAARPYVEEVVSVDGTAEEVLPAYGIECHRPAGIYEQELVYELSLLTGKALVFTDILFNLTQSYLQQNIPERSSMFGWLGASDFFGITRFGRWFFLSDRHAYQQWLRSLADNIPNLCVICVAHGSPITKNCAERLRDAADRLR